MSASEIRLDRYAKFRKLGMFEEFLVRGGQWRDARAARAAVRTFHPLSTLQTRPSPAFAFFGACSH